LKFNTATVRRSHRVLGLVIGVQLLLWTLSGAFFAWTDLDEIHGDHLRAPAAPIEIGDAWVSPSSIKLDRVEGFEPDRLEELGIVRIGASTYYRFADTAGHVVLADVESGAVRSALTEEEALALARASFVPDTPVKSIERITTEDVGAHHEYRSGSLPAWVIQFDHGSATRVYVAERDGVVTKHRNGMWRAFDFLWMLHTMDYRARDDFNNPLLRGVAAMAVVAVLSGFLLWGRTSMLLRRRRR
jgi:hypothetical protein